MKKFPKFVFPLIIILLILAPLTMGASPQQDDPAMTPEAVVGMLGPILAILFQIIKVVMEKTGQKPSGSVGMITPSGS